MWGRACPGRSGSGDGRGGGRRVGVTRSRVSGRSGSPARPRGIPSTASWLGSLSFVGWSQRRAPGEPNLFRVVLASSDESCPRAWPFYLAGTGVGPSSLAHTHVGPNDASRQLGWSIPGHAPLARDTIGPADSSSIVSPRSPRQGHVRSIALHLGRCSSDPSLLQQERLTPVVALRLPWWTAKALSGAGGQLGILVGCRAVAWVIRCGCGGGPGVADPWFRCPSVRRP
jgi:hypothetical protein